MAAPEPKQPTAQEVAAANVKQWEQGFDDGFKGREKSSDHPSYRMGHRAGVRVYSRENL